MSAALAKTVADTGARGEIVERKPLGAAPIQTQDAFISMIERAARDPSVDIDKMERLFEMQERALARAAKTEFDGAFAVMQANLPTIDQNGRIIIADKSNANKIIQSTAFAKFEDINDAVKPILAEYGFGLAFKTGLSSDGRVTVTGILSHRAGHREETTMVLPHDSTGSKNAVQAIGSSTSYGRRYTTLALLNITSRLRDDRDDDGAAASGPATISEDQEIELRDLAESVGADMPKFYRHFGVDRLSDLPVSKLGSATAMLRQKGQRR